MKPPYDHYFWQLREIQRTLDRLQPQLRALDSIPQSIQDQIDQLAALQDKFTLPPYYLDVVERIQESLHVNPTLEQLPFLGSSEMQLIYDFRRRQNELDSLARDVMGAEALLQSPTERVVESLVSIEALLSSAHLSDQLLEAATQPQRAFQEFASQQLEIAADAASNIEKTNRLYLIDSAADLLDEMNSGIELAVLMNPSLGDVVLSTDWQVNLYAELAEGIKSIDFEETELDFETVVAESCPGRVTELGSKLVRLVYDLNTEAEREGKPSIFKPTTKLLYACSVIPTRIATDEESFDHLVDQLFFLLYEGSGRASRLTERKSRDHFEALWRVKHLRLSARHDVDHGSDLEKKNRTIGEAYAVLIGSVIPRTKPDWCRAQVTLYSQLVEMLEVLWFGEGTEGEIS